MKKDDCRGTKLGVLEIPLVLASQSPRRKEILEKSGFSPRVEPANIDEEFPENMPLEQIPVLLASLKANALINRVSSGEVILAADTVVILNNSIINKPGDFVHAYEMLQNLSGKQHEVITGVCLLSPKKEFCFYDTTKVTFKHLTHNEICFYIQNYAPFDKAGSYGVQDFIGMVGIERIEGCFFNVMGLPVRLVYKHLETEFLPVN